ncbi:MAG TPA: hypothetical protein ENO21_00975 [Firmicutes bacterium]|nr:hypothetical protein [Bacillota bacterium]
MPAHTKAAVSRGRQGWLMPLVLLLVLCAAAGCDEPKDEARVDGDTVYLPETCSLFRDTRTTPDAMPFVKFDGSYPEGWPDSTKLPAETHLLADGSLEWDRPGSSRFKGIIPGRQPAVVEDWKARIVAAGWTVQQVYDDEGPAFPTGQATGDTTIMAEDPGPRPQPYIQLTIWKHHNTGGWVYFECFLYMGW